MPKAFGRLQDKGLEDKGLSDFKMSGPSVKRSFVLERSDLLSISEAVYVQCSLFRILCSLFFVPYICANVKKLRSIS